jgi:hypothetical protein
MAEDKGIMSSVASRLSPYGRRVGSSRYTQAILSPLRWVHAHAPLCAFVLIAFVGAWALHGQQMSTSNKLYENNLRSCARGNNVRINQSNIVDDIRQSNRLVAQFLHDASIARAKSYQSTGLLSDKRAAAEYHLLEIRLLNDTSKLQQYSAVNCRLVVKKP